MVKEGYVIRGSTYIAAPSVHVMKTHRGGEVELHAFLPVRMVHS